MYFIQTIEFNILNKMCKMLDVSFSGLSVVSLLIMCIIMPCSWKFTLTERLLGGHNQDDQGGVREYCLASENFEPKRCLKNEVIIIHSAVYGRMRIGRCLEDEDPELLSRNANDPRFLGCSTDVVHVLDKKCSGKNTCEIRTTNSDLLKERACHASLKSYLEVDYECVAVAEDDRSCLISVSSNPVHIMRSSLSSSKLNCGTKSQPWRLEAPVGQQISVSLFDFGVKRNDAAIHLHQSVSENECLQYGYVFEKSARKNISICALKTERQKSLYKSQSNVIEVILSSESDRNADYGTYLLRFSAVGCSDLLPPIDSWLKRSDNGAIVGCYSSRQTWHLRCTGSEWVGVVGNCTRDEQNDKIEAISVEIHQQQHVTQVLVIVAIGFLALIVCLIIICCGAVCLRRYYATSAQKYCQKLEEIENDQRLSGTATKHAMMNVLPQQREMI